MHTVQQNRRFAETRRLSSKCTRDSEIPNFCTEGKLSFSVSDSLEKIKESEENFWYFFPNFLKFQIYQTSSVQKNAKSSGISFCQGSHLQKFNTMLKKRADGNRLSKKTVSRRIGKVGPPESKAQSLAAMISVMPRMKLRNMMKSSVPVPLGASRNSRQIKTPQIAATRVAPCPSP